MIRDEKVEVCGVKPSEIGENITTTVVDLLSLVVYNKLHFHPATSNVMMDNEQVKVQGDHPVIVITGLANPCPHIEKVRPGLQEKIRYVACTWENNR